MSTFRILLNKRLKAILFPLQFKRIKNFYIRVINNVYQVIKIEYFYKVYTKNGCRISFCTFPFCIEFIESHLLDGGTLYTLNQLENTNAIRDYDRWLYDDATKNEVVDNIAHFVVDYLIPFFSKTSNSDNALRAFRNLENHFDQVRKDEILRLNITNGKIHDWTGIFDSLRIYFAFKEKNYPLAKVCLIRLIRMRTCMSIA